MNIIEHLTRTVTPILLGNTAGSHSGNHSALLEKLYAIIVARLADNNISTPFSSRTITNEDTNFFDALLPEATHRSNMVRELSTHYSMPEQETQSLIQRAAPLVYNELRNLAGTTPLSTFLTNNLSSITSAVPAWAYGFIPAGVLSALNLNTSHTNTQTRPDPVVRNTTRVEEQLVATPKEEGGLMKTLLPIIGLLILAALAWALLKSCNKQPEPVATPVVASTTASSVVVTASTPVAMVPASASSATVVASTVVIEGASTNAATAVAPVATVISTTEPSVLFENGRLSFYFVTGKADVAPGAVDKAEEILAAAKQGKKVGISGYTDSTGNASANAKLAKDRAEAVKKFLMDNGVPASQLELRKPNDSVGAQGKDQEGRRVDAYIIDSPEVVTQQAVVVASPAK